MSIYKELGLQAQVWIELHKNKDGKIAYYGGIVHAGYSREGLPFNAYNEKLFLVIEGYEKDVEKLAELLRRMTIRLPNDIQESEG